MGSASISARNATIGSPVPMSAIMPVLPADLQQESPLLLLSHVACERIGSSSPCAPERDAEACKDVLYVQGRLVLLVHQFWDGVKMMAMALHPGGRRRCLCGCPACLLTR